MDKTIFDRAELRNSLLAALAYFDLFDLPLTVMELRRWRWGGPSGEPTAADILDALKDTPTGESEGYYFLAGRDKIVGIRQRRYRLAERKFQLAGRFARWARLLPSVRLVAVCNSLALANSEKESDIDLFIVCRPGTLWATRLLLAGFLKLLGRRPTPTRSADTYCLSFFLSEDRLDISNLALPAGDAYLCYWTATLAPIYDAGGVMEKFARDNAWVRASLPGFAAPEIGERRLIPRCRSTFWLRPLLEWFDAAAKKIQAGRFPLVIAELANLDSRVVVADDILKFHVNDRRAFFDQRFRARLAELGLKP